MAEYIERKKALNVCEMHYQHCLEMRDWHGDRVADDIKTDIETIPVADVVEVKHGKWIEKDSNYDTYWDCSVCGESFCFIEGSPTDNLYKYCPNCGAKMDGERKE